MKGIRYFLTLCIAALSVMTASAQYYGAYDRYIDRYWGMAVEQMQKYHVPASITLAQGLIETRAGQSKLATQANNHFGIKCYSWKGPVVEYDDTLKHNCYRNYGCPEDSFLDHAKFLKGKRYSSLYDLDVSDYQGWAIGLRACGYAEDPDYARKLISIIEQYELNLLAPSIAGEPLADAGSVPPPPKRKGKAEKAQVPPPPPRHERHVAEVPEPSRAQIDQRVARNRPVRDRSRAGTNTSTTASADND